MACSPRPDDLPEWIYQLTMLPRFEGIMDAGTTPPVPATEPAADRREGRRARRSPASARQLGAG